VPQYNPSQKLRVLKRKFEKKIRENPAGKTYEPKNINGR
jgi:hypothetical protein